jgi:hypothetical protein
MLPQIRRVQKSLGWNAADQQAGSTEARALFDQRGAQPILAGAHGRRIPARPTTDN